jgi:hypothetical protein
MNEIPFFKDQMFWAMRNKGLIDPEVIDEYIARDGYFGAAKAYCRGKDIGFKRSRRSRFFNRIKMGVCQ